MLSDQVSFKFPAQSELTIYNSGLGPSQMSSSTSILKLITPKKLVQFDIYVDPSVGTQTIQVYDKKQISNAVELFALKYEVTDIKKINKLKKFVK